MTQSTDKPFLYAVASRSSVMALAKLRSYKQITVSEYQGKIWFKLPPRYSAETIPYLPCLFYREIEGGLAKGDSKVPSMEPLPDGLTWMPILQWWKIYVQSNSLQHYVLDQASLCLVASKSMVKPTGMLVNIDVLGEFVMDASIHRLKGIVMAVNHKQECWIEGDLLPSLKAPQFCIHENVATPLGKTWSPKVNAFAVQASMGASRDDRVIFYENGEVDVIPSETLVPLTAANLRATQVAFSTDD